MPQDKTITLTVDVKTRLSSLESSVQEMQKRLSELKGPDNLTNNLKNAMNDLLDRIKNVQEYTKNNQLNLVDGKKVDSEMDHITKAFNKLARTFENSQNKFTLKNVSAEAQTLIKSVEKYNQAINQTTQDIKAQEKAVDDIKQKMAQAQENVDTKSKVVEALKAQIEPLKQQAAAYQAILDQKRKDQKDNGRTDAQNEAAIRRMNAYKQLQEILQQLAPLEDQLGVAQKNLQKQEQSSATTVAELNIKLQESEERLFQLQQALDQISADAFSQVKDELIKMQEAGAQFSFDPQAITTIEELLQYVEEINQVDNERVINSMKTLAVTAGNAAKESKNLSEGMSEATERGSELSNQLDRFKQKAAYFLGLENAVHLFKRAVQSAFNTVKDLDKVMTETAVVTEFNVGDMWAQLPEYTQRANELGVSIHSAYEAATLYYQQGLKTNEVVAVSNETLKMARIAGLDAATATDRMTNALRGFNMAIDETNAQNINDVYSKLAAITASNVDEISTAMTKVASLAHNANMSFENTAAFLSQIIETTRESAETAGTALKTVVARFSEVKEMVSKGELLGTDAEGEAIDVNRVSKALRTAGIDLNEYLTGMKGLDEIFIELAAKWDSLDQVQQRYIATMAAGSRQQSRFIALMSDYARTQELVGAANNASGASQEQFNKTLESLESKLNKLKNAWDSFLMSIANNEVIKMVVDALTALLEGINKVTDGLPGIVSGLAKIGLVFGGAKLVKPIINRMFDNIGTAILNKTKNIGNEAGATGAKSFTTSFSSNIKDRFKNGLFNMTQTQQEFDGLAQRLRQYDWLTNDEKREILVVARTQGVEEACQKMEELGSQQDKVNEGQKRCEVDGKKMYESITAGAQKSQKDLRAVGAAVAAVGGALMGVSALMENFGAPDEVVELTRNLGMVVTTVGGIITAVGTLSNMFPLVGAKAAAAGITAQAAWGWISVAAIAIIALIAGVVALYNEIQNNTPEGRIKRLSEELNKAKEAAEDAEKAYSELVTNQSEYNTLIDQVKELTKGTKEWREAIYKVNQETLKLLALNSKLAGYIVTDENGMMTLSDEGWSAYFAQMRSQVEQAQAQLAGTQGNLYAAKRDKTTKDMNAALTKAYISGDYSQMSEALTNAQDASNAKYQYVLSSLNQRYGATQELSAIANALSKSDIIDQIIDENAVQKTYKDTLANTSIQSMLGAIAGGPIAQFATIVASAVNTGEELKALREEYETRTGQEYEESDMQKAYDELSEIVSSYKKQDRINEIAGRLVDTGLFSGSLDVNLTSIQDPEIQNMVKDQIDLIKAQQEQVDKQVGNYFGDQGAIDIFGSYDVAANLLNVLGAISSTKGGEGIITTLNTLQSAMEQGEFTNLIKEFNMLDYTSAIGGAKDLKRWTEEGTDAQKALAASVLEVNEELYNTTSQANELYKILGSDVIQEMAEDGQITADELREMATEGSALKDVLDNTGVSINTLATYYDNLTKGTLNAASATTDFVKILDKVMSTQNTIADTFALIENFDPGRSITEVHSFVDDVKEKFSELKELGAYSDDAMIAYEKLVLGEERFNEELNKHQGNMEGVAQATAQLLDLMGSNFYGLWKAFSNGDLGDAFSVGKNGQIDVDMTKVQSVDEVVLKLQEDLNISHEFAEAMFTDLVNSSDKLKTAFDRLSAVDGFAEWVQNGRVLGNVISYDVKELNLLAEQMGLAPEELATQLTTALSSIGDDFQVAIEDYLNEEGSIDPDSTLFKSLSQELQDSILEGTQAGLNEFQDLASLYDFFIDLGMNDEQARASLQQVWDDASDAFDDLQFAFDEKSLTLAAGNEKELAEYGGEVSAKEISNGIVEGSGDPKVTKAQEISALQYSQTLAEAVAEGATAALLAPLIAFEKQVENILNWLKTNVAGIDVPVLGKIFGGLNNLNAPNLSSNLIQQASGKVNGMFTDRINKATADLEKMDKAVSTVAATFEHNDAVNKSLDTLFDNVDKQTRDFYKDGSAYLTDTARKVGDDITNDANDNIEEVAEKVISSLGLGDPSDELYNINQEIAAQLREQTKLEREYTVLTRDQNTTLEDMRNNYFAQVDNLSARAQSEANRNATAQALIDALDQRYFLIDNELKTFSELGVSDLISFDGTKITKDIVGINSISDPDIKSAFDKYASMFEGYVNEFIESKENLIDIQEEIEDFQKAAIDSYLSFEERVMDAYIKEKERELDKIEALNDSLDEVANDIIKKIQEQIDDARQARENEKKEQDITDKENRLAYLRRDTSGANALEIAQLEKELAESRQDYSDSLVDQALDQMQADADLAAQQRAVQIGALRQIHEDMQMAGEYWPAVYDLMNSAFTNGTLNYNSDLVNLLKKSENFASLSTIGQQNWLDDVTQQITEAYPVLSNQFIEPRVGEVVGQVATSQAEIMANSQAIVDAAESNVRTEVGEIRNEIREGVLTAENAAKEAAEAALEAAKAAEESAGTTRDNNDALNKAYQKISELESQIFNLQQQISDLYKQISGMQWPGGNNNNNSAAISTIVPSSTNALSNTQLVKISANNAGTSVGKLLQSMGPQLTDSGLGIYTQGRSEYQATSTSTQQKLLAQLQGLYAQGSFKSMAEFINTNSDALQAWGIQDYALALLKQLKPNTGGKTGITVSGVKVYASGGMIDSTGPAWLDGTRSNPEAVLSAEDTRNFIALRDILASLVDNGAIGSGDVGGDAYYDIDINAEIGSDYDVDQLANRIKKQITESASYRNVNTINLIR